MHFSIMKSTQQTHLKLLFMCALKALELENLIILKGKSESQRNKTGLQPVSRPVEPILGFHIMFKKLTAPPTLFQKLWKQDR